MRTGYFLLLLASPLSAAAASEGAGASSLVLPLLRMVGALIVVLLLFYATLFIVRKLSSARNAASTRVFQLVEILPLSPKTRLLALKLGKRVLVLGASDQSVQRIAELDWEEFSSLGRGKASDQEEGFRRKLLRFTTR